MGYDLFVAALRCPHCGLTTPADVGTNMQTKLRDDPDVSSLKVGDALIIDHATAVDGGYLAVQPPSEPVHICHIWACPFCQHYPNWAEVVVRHGRIESNEAMRLDFATLERLHYLDEDAWYFIADRAGVKLDDLPMQEAVTLLRRFLLGSRELR
jgi:hypothetical protein